MNSRSMLAGLILQIGIPFLFIILCVAQSTNNDFGSYSSSPTSTNNAFTSSPLNSNERSEEYNNPSASGSPSSTPRAVSEEFLIDYSDYYYPSPVPSVRQPQQETSEESSFEYYGESVQPTSTPSSAPFPDYGPPPPPPPPAEYHEYTPTPLGTTTVNLGEIGNAGAPPPPPPPPQSPPAATVITIGFGTGPVMNEESEGSHGGVNGTNVGTPKPDSHSKSEEVDTTTGPEAEQERENTVRKIVIGVVVGVGGAVILVIVVIIATITVLRRERRRLSKNVNF